MINAGAIAAVSLIPAASPDERFALIQDFYSGFAGRRLELDPEVYASKKTTGSRNRAIGYMLEIAHSTSPRPTWPGWVPRWHAVASTLRLGAG